MAIRETLYPEGARFKDTLFPAFYREAGAAGGPPALCLGFDDATSEEAHWPISGKDYGGSASILVTIYWYAANATSGVVRWGVRLAAYTPETDTASVEAKTYATADEQNDTHLGTTSKRMHETTHTLSSTELDSIVAGDVAWLGIYREGGDAGDTMSNDALLERVEVREA
jgi:hypothetical protein